MSPPSSIWQRMPYMLISYFIRLTESEEEIEVEFPGKQVCVLGS